MVIAIRLCATSEEDGTHKLELSLTDLDGKLLGPPAKATFVTKTRPNEQYAWTQAVIGIHQIQILEPNEYLLNLQINGHSIANTTLCVIAKSRGDASSGVAPLVRF
jgi:hypothetical protein